MEQDRYFTGSEQYSAILNMKFNDLKSNQSLFLPQVNSNSSHDTNSAWSRDFDRNVDLQVVPSFDDQVFVDSFSPHDDYDEVKAISQNQIGTNNQLPAENVVKLFESLACLPEEGVIDKEERTESSHLKIRKGENATTTVPERRRQSDTDSLDVYLKPCVITPTKVEDLYSTLEEGDNMIFQFPPNKDSSPTSSRSDTGAVQENEVPIDSNVFQIQLRSLSHRENLNIESSTEKHLDSAHHRNELFEETSHCCYSMTDMKSSHRLASNQPAQLEPQITTNKGSFTHFRSFSSNTEGYQESFEFPEHDSSFSPLPEEMSRSRIFPPKPTNISRNVFNVSTSLDFCDKEYLHIGNKREQEDTSSDKEGRNGFLSRETAIDKGTVTTENVIQKTSETTPLAVQNQEGTITFRRDEEPVGRRIFDSQHFEHLSRNSITLEKESCITMFSSKKVVEMPLRDEVQDTCVDKEQPFRDTRMNHNDTEKQRRDQMKSRFESLRQVIPRTEKLEKTPKIQILRQAWKYIIYLEEEGRTLELIKREEKEKNKTLLKKLQNIVKI